MIRDGNSIKLIHNYVADEKGDQPEVAMDYDDFFVGGKFVPVPAPSISPSVSGRQGRAEAHNRSG